MTLEGQGRVVQVPLPENFQKADLERALQARLKRFSSGFLKTVALHTPAATPPMPQLGILGGGQRFSLLRDTLAEERNLTSTDLQSGRVPEDADLLLLASPDKLDEKQLFAVDQFLMHGGTVVVATSPFDVATQGALSAHRQNSGLGEWLGHQGITLDGHMVLDPQNAAFPIPVNRRIGGFVVQETQLVDYPYFVGVRGEGLEAQSGLAAGINQVTLTWPSPITLDDKKNQDRKVIRLLESTDQAWISDSLDIQPDFGAYGPLGFPPGEQSQRQLLAVAVQGRFESWFKDKSSPLAAEEEGTARFAVGMVDTQAERPTRAGSLCGGVVHGGLRGDVKMKKWNMVLSVVLIVHLAVAVAVNLAVEDYGAFEAQEKLLAWGDEEVGGLRIQDGENSVVLSQREGRWVLPESDDFPADQQAVSGLLDKLASLEKGWPVARTGGAARRFNFDEEDFARKLTLTSTNEELAELYVGTSPGFRKVHVRPAGEDAVYAVSLQYMGGQCYGR